MTIKVASVQMVSFNNDYEGKLSRGESHIDDAVNKGAKLILLPEFSLAGYAYTDSIWKMAEPLKGRTYKWQKSLCEKHDVYIGSCILESSKDDFYDTFVLTGPNKDEIWAHRKIEAPAYEAHCFKGAGVNSNVFDTPIGRIGVVICFDSSKTHTISGLIKGNAHIVLIAYSYPGLPWYFPAKDRKCWSDVYLNTPRIYARYLHVPVVTSNKSGHFLSPVPGAMGIKFEADFTGGSAIVDQNTNVLSSLSQAATGVLVQDMVLEKPDILKIKHDIPKERWLLPYNRRIRVMMNIASRLGMMRYKYSRKRKDAARVNVQHSIQ